MLLTPAYAHSSLCSLLCTEYSLTQQVVVDILDKEKEKGKKADKTNTG